jgi:hypothetical protein
MRPKPRPAGTAPAENNAKLPCSRPRAWSRQPAAEERGASRKPTCRPKRPKAASAASEALMAASIMVACCSVGKTLVEPREWPINGPATPWAKPSAWHPNYMPCSAVLTRVIVHARHSTSPSRVWSRWPHCGFDLSLPTGVLRAYAEVTGILLGDSVSTRRRDGKQQVSIASNATIPPDSHGARVRETSETPEWKVVCAPVSGATCLCLQCAPQLPVPMLAAGLQKQLIPLLTGTDIKAKHTSGIALSWIG